MRPRINEQPPYAPIWAVNVELEGPAIVARRNRAAVRDRETFGVHQPGRIDARQNTGHRLSGRSRVRALRSIAILRLAVTAEARAFEPATSWLKAHRGVQHGNANAR